MILLGITGGIGMGKSTAAAVLSKRGLPVADTDLIARTVVASGSAALAEIRDAFGDGMILPNGALDRQRLAEVVFADIESRRRLEAILHPRIRAEWGRRVAEWREQGHDGAAVVIPLLFETAAESAFDHTLCVACSTATQVERLRRRGWTDEHIRQRVAAQFPIETKVERASFVVWTEPPAAEHERQLAEILRTCGIASAVVDPAS